MSKTAINLLPWRASQRNHILKNLIITLLIWLTILIFCIYFSYDLGDSFLQKKTIIDNQVKQQSDLITRYRKQIYLLKKQHVLNGSKKLTYPNLLQLLSKLSRIPMKEASLTDLKVKNSLITLKGISRKQNELDSITGFLKQQPNIERLQLQHVENANNQIVFTISFTLKGSQSV